VGKECTAAVKQENKIGSFGMVKRNSVDRSKETILALYKSLVRSYCIVFQSGIVILSKM